jgi:hypothetical protein
MVPNCAVGLEENMIAASLRAQTVSALDGSGKPRTRIDCRDQAGIGVP